MKNNFIKITLIFLLNFNYLSIAISDDFIFDVSELEITEKGNIYHGTNGGKVTTSNGIEITAETFKYNKLTSLLETKGNVVLIDKIKNIKISSEQIFYLKNKELAYTKGVSKAVTSEDIEINSNEFLKYNKLSSILEAKGNVEIIDKVENMIIHSNHIFYFKNEDKFSTKGVTKIDIEDEYLINGRNLILERKDMFLSSEFKTRISDTFNNVYELNDFNYLINDKVLKGNKIKLITNYQLQNSDEYFFETGFFNFKNKIFSSKDIEVKFYKEMYGEKENDPRLKGVSASGNEFKTFLNKGSFTTCKQDENCPPWLIESKKVTHDKIKKQIIYDKAWLKIYDIPVVYFPKFFHPDPSVERQSGFLRPYYENSDTLGTALYTPYFKIISDDKDMTFKPRFYDDDKYVFQSEYRQKNEKSTIIADFSYTKGYKSKLKGELKDSRTHLFINTIKNLNFDDFLNSSLETQYQKVSNDTYLKIFNLSSPLLAPDNSVLEAFVTLDLENENYDFTASIEQFETLSGLNSDRFQYALPAYNFSSVYINEKFMGNFNFNSYGNNTLKNTNTVSTNITNDINYISLDSFLDTGIQTNFSLFVKNLNSIGKNDSNSKSSPQSEIMSAYMFNAYFPLINNNEDMVNTINPKLSVRFSPHQMRNHKTKSSRVDATNVFSFSRLGLSDSFEEGGSLTIGVDYKKEKITIVNDEKEIEDFFEMKLATVIRAENEENIPINSTINKKNSNILGNMNYKVSESFAINYDFSIDNDLNTFEYNSIETDFTYKNFNTQIAFLEENGELGSGNILSNTIQYNFDDNNTLKFKTRRNRAINLTEYYDLLYQYKNDCLTAGIQFKKRFYNSADIKPSEEIFFSITIVPLGTFSPAPIIPSRVLNEN